MTVKTAIIKGTPYISDVGVNAGKPLGNTSKLTYAQTTDTKDLPDFQNPGGGLDDTMDRIKEATVTLSCRHVSIAVLTLALGGTAAAVAAGAVAAEPHTVVELDSLISLDHLQDMSIPLTVKDEAGLVTYVEGTDYLRKRGGIIPITGGNIAAANVVKIGYTKAKHQRIQALVSLIQEKRMHFDGINERSNKPWAAIFHRIKFGPAKNIELIGDDFMSFDIEGKLLKDESVTDPAKSQYMELLVGDL